MIRKLVKNTYQLKLNIPSEIIKKLGLDGDSKVEIKEVDTPEGKGFVVLKVSGKRLQLKKGWIKDDE